MGMARTIGVAAGITVLLIVLAASRPTVESPRLGATVRMTVEGPGEVGVEPASPATVVGADDLRAGDPPRRGVVTIRNFASRPAGIRLIVPADVAPGLTPAAGQVRVRVTRGRSTLADTTLIGLLSGTAATTIGVGGAASIGLTVWIPAGIHPLFAGEEINGSLRVRPLSDTGPGAG